MQENITHLSDHHQVLPDVRDALATYDHTTRLQGSVPAVTDADVAQRGPTTAKKRPPSTPKGMPNSSILSVLVSMEDTPLTGVDLPECLQPTIMQMLQINQDPPLQEHQRHFSPPPMPNSADLDRLHRLSRCLAMHGLPLHETRRRIHRAPRQTVSEDCSHEMLRAPSPRISRWFHN